MQSNENRVWREFAVGDLFSNSHGRRLNKEDRQKGRMPLLTAGKSNNGVTQFISNEGMPIHSDFISVDMFGNAFYHGYMATADDNIYFFENKNVNSYIKQFLAPCIMKQAIKYSYGKQFRQKNADKLFIMLPVTDSGEPDYAYMERCVSSKRGGMLMRYREFAESRLSDLEYKEIPALDEKEWQEFPLEKIFTVSSGKRLETRNKVPGNRPFIGATDNGNGVTGFVDNDNASKDSNVLGVNYNGAPCIAFYHPYECIFTDDVKRLHLRDRDDNRFVLLFFTTIFAMQRSKYSYGYKFKERRMLRQKLMIPVTDSGEPDYDYMEQYSKNLMLRKYGQYMAFLDSHQKGAKQ